MLQAYFHRFRNWVGLRVYSKHRKFRVIYQENLWGDAESRSGSGSNLANTAAIREEIPRLIENYGIRSIFDAPCGDFFWFREMNLKIAYQGGDIVPDLIEANRDLYEAENRKFIEFDLTNDIAPGVDLILCRDALVHFSYQDIRATLRNMRASGATYLLTTTFASPDRKNKDILTGEWRPLNLQAAPFSFPPPLVSIDERYLAENGIFSDKTLGLWKISDLPIQEI
ncbi:class I SAM-dependent methyltransferase [Chitinimonas lacunae]|uniref:Class I SAM-dependent methyltransferase n=1 Tax=Chitinimonas lacunae TaxID=1963018 RepID=A0ABV8MYL1_9NEIS